MKNIHNSKPQTIANLELMTYVIIITNTNMYVPYFLNIENIKITKISVKNLQLVLLNKY